jgi:SAM-dependent methyltransferase
VSGEVADRWRKLIASPRSVYATRAVPAREVRALAASGYARWITEGVPRGAAILEAGCGGGKFSLALAWLGYRVTALDASAGVLANLAGNRERLAAEFARPLAVETREGDAEALPFADGTFDVVTNEGVLEHWLERDARIRVLTEMARVTRPGGRVVVFVPNGRHPFYGWWRRTGYPGYASMDEVPWFRYHWSTLAEEMRDAGLREIEADGLSPWGTLAVWPNWRVLRAAAAVLARVLPEPRPFRRWMGFNLVARGTKP